jgi:predicted nucleotidyltransferase
MNYAIQNKSELFLLIKKYADNIKKFGVNEIGVFGSFRRDMVTQQSDIDFLVNFDPQQKTYQNLFDLYTFLTEKTGRKVEVVTKQGLNKHIGLHILKEVEYVSL